MTTACRICDNTLDPVHDFGRMPLANGFLAPDNFDQEYFFNLAIGYCNQCLMLQLLEQPDPKKMFHENYPFFTGSSKRMVDHFEQLSKFILSSLSKRDPFIVEIGSNDGTHLGNFASKGIRHLGIEPSQNVADVAQKNGVATICDFFSPVLAQKIVAEKGYADVITTANVLCHIPDIQSFIKACDLLLDKEGLIIFEDPYLGDIIKNTAYDQIYDEHVYFFSLLSVQNLFGKFGFELIDAIPQWTHGGSMRYVLSRKGQRKKTTQVELLTQNEIMLGLNQRDIYQKFSGQIASSKIKLINLVEAAVKAGKSVIGYAATSKSTTVINYCGLTKKHIQYICDTTPLKQGKFTPGSHIPVISMDEFKNTPPDYAILFAWNHAQEILAKESEYIENDGKFIYFVPEVKIWPS